MWMYLLHKEQRIPSVNTMTRDSDMQVISVESSDSGLSQYVYAAEQIHLQGLCVAIYRQGTSHISQARDSHDAIQCGYLISQSVTFHFKDRNVRS